MLVLQIQIVTAEPSEDHQADDPEGSRLPEIEIVEPGLVHPEGADAIEHQVGDVEEQRGPPEEENGLDYPVLNEPRVLEVQPQGQEDEHLSQGEQEERQTRRVLRQRQIGYKRVPVSWDEDSEAVHPPYRNEKDPTQYSSNPHGYLEPAHPLLSKGGEEYPEHPAQSHNPDPWDNWVEAAEWPLHAHRRRFVEDDSQVESNALVSNEIKVEIRVEENDSK